MILFVNGSPNREGNTAALARKLLKGKDYETLNLVDYKIYPLGQQYDDDQYKEVLRRMQQADVLVMGSPVYWHSMTGLFRQLLDLLYGADMRSLKGKQLYFIFQGAGPTKFLHSSRYLGALRSTKRL